LALQAIVSAQNAHAQDRGIFLPGAGLQLDLAERDEPKTDCGEPWPYRIGGVCLETAILPAGAPQHLKFYADQVQKAGWRLFEEKDRMGPVTILKFGPPAQFRNYWRLCIMYSPSVSGEREGGDVDISLWSRSDGCDPITD
jgi:hypothetical protein